MSLAMLRSEYWESLSSTSLEFWVNVIRIHEVVFILVILVVLMPLLPSFEFGAKMAIPTLQNSTYGTIGSNPLFSYPITLKGHSCWPSELSFCLENPTSSDLCCVELYNKDAIVEQTISNVDLVLIVTILALGFLVLRCLLWEMYIARWRQHDQQAERPRVDKRFWRKVLWDSVLALAICQIITAIVTNYVKEAVGAPRPIYYALQLFSSVHTSDRSDLKDNSQLSFPSGHASMSFSGLGLPALLCFCDSLKFRASAPLTSFVFVLLSVTPLLVAFFIAMTRVSDCWHFAGDIVVGWFIGGGSVLFSFFACSGLSRDVHRMTASFVPRQPAMDVESLYPLSVHASS